MDVNQMCGLLSIANAPIICTIPTTYFTQGINGFAQCNLSLTKTDYRDDDDNNNNDNDDDEEDEENYEVSDNESSNCDNYNEPQDLDEDKGYARRRVRYLREEYNCAACKYTCTTERAYVRHAIKCNGSGTDARLSCVVCGKDVKTSSALDAHMRRHRDGKAFRCDLCKYKSLQLKKLIQHRRMHTGEKPHLCPYCDYRSSRRDNLKSHVKRVHKRTLNGDTFVPRSIVIAPRDN